jgi:hypothetical protein
MRFLLATRTKYSCGVSIRVLLRTAFNYKETTWLFQLAIPLQRLKMDQFSGALFRPCARDLKQQPAQNNRKNPPII